MAVDPDDTVRLTPRPKRRRRAWMGAAAAVLAVVALSGSGYALLTGPSSPVTLPSFRAVLVSVPPPAPPPVAPAPSPAPRPAPMAPPVIPASAVPSPVLPRLASEAAVLASHSGVTEEYRFLPQPEIYIIQFATLAEQASALNRAAAMIEKAGYPHDRVLGEAELDSRIRAEGSTPETFYYGHDYRAADLLRVFQAIDASATPMTLGETWLRGRLAAWGWHPGINAALISLVQDNAAAGLDDAVRATILRHELSHGLFFTSPAYAFYSQQFWDGVLSEPERARFRSFLSGEGYDTALNELVVNETQAYLMHTANKQFFNAQAVGIPDQRLDMLRALFLTGMPPGWLRDCTTPVARLPRRRPRRRSRARGLRVAVGHGSVSIA